MLCPAELPGASVIIVYRSVKIKPQWKIEDVAGALCGHPRASAKRNGGRRKASCPCPFPFLPSAFLPAGRNGTRKREGVYFGRRAPARSSGERGDAFGKALFSPPQRGEGHPPRPTQESDGHGATRHRTRHRNRKRRLDGNEARSGPASQESSLSLMRPESRESERSLFRTSKREGRERKG
jgi:hypothetical protein